MDLRILYAGLIFFVGNITWSILTDRKADVKAKIYAAIALIGVIILEAYK